MTHPNVLTIYKKKTISILQTQHISVIELVLYNRYMLCLKDTNCFLYRKSEYKVFVI